MTREESFSKGIKEVISTGKEASFKEAIRRCNIREELLSRHVDVDDDLVSGM